MCVEGRKALAFPTRMIRKSFKKVASTQDFEEWVRCRLATMRRKQYGQRQEIQCDHVWLGQNRDRNG